MSETPTGIERAVTMAGGQTELAHQIGVTPQAVSLMVKKGYVPVERLAAVRKATGVALGDLCAPDLRELFE